MACHLLRRREFHNDTGGSPRATRCREFRYDSGRARYLARERDPVTLAPRNDAVWTDYVGDGPYAERFFDREAE